MGKPLKILIVDDSEDDALLMVRALEKGGYDPELRRVDNPSATVTALDEQSWDVVLSDFSMPMFNGFDVLKIVKEKKLDVPFIIVSGAIGEETAAELMRAGAHDYIMKNNLTRLAPAIERELKDAETRRQRRWAQESLRQSEERYRVIVETVSDAIITIDEDNRIILANSAVEKIFGYKPEEVLRQQVIMLMPERMRERHLSAMQRYLETGQRRAKWTAAERPGLHKDGHEIPLEVSYETFMMNGKHFFTGIVRDVTERKEAEKEKEYKSMLETFTREIEILVAERMMSLLALQVADRVRNPATVIGLTSRSMRDEGAIPEKVSAGLIDIAEEAHKLEDLVVEFQDLMKSTKHAFSYQDINEILRNALYIIEKEAADKRVELTVKLHEDPLRINAQKELLRLALFNMLRNAIEVTPEGGRVTVSTWRTEKSVVFSVSDTGKGIPAQAIEKMFDPSYSAQVYRFGMGLPLIKQIVSEHMGEVEVESIEGQGATFKVIFPIRWEQASEKPKPGNSKGVQTH